MRFKVTGISNIVCSGCGGITNVAPNRIYDSKDLTCNCEPREELMRFEVSHICDITFIDSGSSARIIPDSVYLITKDGNIEEINNKNMEMFEEPYRRYVKTACIEVVGRDKDGNVLVQNVGDSPDRRVISKIIFSETYEYECDIPIVSREVDPTPPEDAAKPRENSNQAKFFEKDPENVINPDESKMEEPGVREYLKSLGWQELLEAAKNNEVIKPPKVRREELEEMIIKKVFHE